MKEELKEYINHIKDLDENQKTERIYDFIVSQMNNFILWNWSDDKERDRELKNLETWLKVEEE